MEEKISAGKVLLTGLMAAGTALWGWFGWLALLWIAAMALDYLSGTAAAMKRGKWSSRAAREGLWHKAGMILAVVVSVLGDVLLGLVINHLPMVQLPFAYTVALSPVVLAWYILTELGSAAENAAKMGAKVPRWLTRMLSGAAEAVDKAGETAAGDREEKKP